MSRQSLEVADIFRQYGQLWRQSHKGHLSLGQLKAMSAIERCRTVALGGHVLQCQSCHHIHIAYNSCRNRHCPKCQASVAHRWLEARKEDLLPVDYYHVVFTLPSEINDLAYQNKSVIYNILFKAVAKTLTTIAGDQKYLGARVGATLVLHTWGSAMTHHPHIHCVVPGGGLSTDGKHWITCRPGFFLPVRVLSRLFRRLFLELLIKAYQTNQLHFYSKMKKVEYLPQFTHWLECFKKKEWVVYSKRPFAGPKAVLDYLSRYTHRVAIANSRLISMDNKGITFKWKNYRKKGEKRYQTMTLNTNEFIHRFLLHILPLKFHRIRHIGLFTNSRRKKNIALARQLLLNQDETASVDSCSIEMDKVDQNNSETSVETLYKCPKCGSAMVVIELFAHGLQPRAPPIELN